MKGFFGFQSLGLTVQSARTPLDYYLVQYPALGCHSPRGLREAAAEEEGRSKAVGEKQEADVGREFCCASGEDRTTQRSKTLCMGGYGTTRIACGGGRTKCSPVMSSILNEIAPLTGYGPIGSRVPAQSPIYGPQC